MATVDRVGSQEWHLQALGAWAVTRAGQELLLPPRGQRLLALLLIEGRRPRSCIAGRLWPGTSASRASSNLRSTTLDLRRRAKGLIVTDGRSLGLAPTVTGDVTRLHAVLRGTDLAMSTVETSEYLLGVEELLPGWGQDWVEAERRRLTEAVADRMAQVLQALVAEELTDHALPLARAALELEPMRESAHRALVAIHLAAGDRVAAWQAYTDFRRRSVAEFGVSPSTRFEELVEPLMAERRARRVSGTLGGRRGGSDRVPARIARRPHPAT